MTATAEPATAPPIGDPTANGAVDARTVGAVLADASVSERPSSRLTPLPTGFEPLDSVLDGGLRAQDLVLVGGRPGVGKTVATLQWARSMAMAGHAAIFVCYEHSEETLLGRLLSLEIGAIARREDLFTVDQLRTCVRELTLGARSVADVAADHPLFAQAHEHLRSYAERLWLVRASAARTGLSELEALVRQQGGSRAALFVDYLQKIPVEPASLDESERVTRIATGLKELALTCGVPVVAVVAADHAGLTARRLRIHHMRGSTALAHEADVVLALNEKWDAVSKVHLAYDPVRARTFRHVVVFSLEKNREGPALVDVQFRKDFANYRFDPQGSFVEEKLVDDALYEE